MNDEDDDKGAGNPPQEEPPTNQDDITEEQEPQAEEKPVPRDDGMEKRLASLEQDMRELRAMVKAMGDSEDVEPDVKTAEDISTDGDSDGDGNPDPTDITIEDLFGPKK